MLISNHVMRENVDEVVTYIKINFQLFDLYLLNKTCVLFPSAHPCFCRQKQRESGLE